MAVIKSGNSTDQLTIDAASKAARVSLYDTAGAFIATLPVSLSGAVDVSDRNARNLGHVTVDNNSGDPASVSVENFPSVQSVVGAVSVTNFPATYPVSAASLPLPAGASTEATLALIKAKTDNLDVLLSTRTKPADTQNVSVSNFPATQAVSIASAVDVSDRAARLVGHVVVDNFSATQPVSATALPLPTNAAQEIGGNLASIAAAMTSGAAKTQTVNGSGVIADVTGKGTQGANALATQDLSDSGRVMKVFSATFSATVAEALVSLTPITDGAAGTPATSFAVTAGKRLRLIAMSVSVNAPSTTAVGATCQLRMTASGAVIASSPLIMTIAAGLIGTQVAQQAASNEIGFPGGIELFGTMQFGITQQGIASAGFRVTLIGYEY